MQKTRHIFFMTSQEENAGLFNELAKNHKKKFISPPEAPQTQAGRGSREFQEQQETRKIGKCSNSVFIYAPEPKRGADPEGRKIAKIAKKIITYPRGVFLSIKETQNGTP